MEKSRPIAVIAREISKNWGETAKGGKIYFGAVPYLNAMYSLNSINDKYGCDDAYSIIAYFLANATTWKGETARNIKKELKKIAGMK